MVVDTLGELLQQIPPALILNVCGSATLLALAFVYFALIKPRRRKAREQAAAQATDQPVASTSSDSAPVTAAVDDDLPDLAMLTDDRYLGAASPPPPTQTPDVPAVAPATIHMDSGETFAPEPVVNVVRDPRDGGLVVVMDGVGYRSLAAVPEVKARFIEVMKQLNSVVNTPKRAAATDPAPAETDPAPQPKSEPASTRDSEDTSTRDDIDPAAILGTPPPPRQDGSLPGQLPTYNMDEAVKPKRGGRFGLGPAKYEYAEVPELDIAGAIEAYLQHRLAYSSDYADRSIHVLPAPGGGVRIQVDDQFYEMVDEIEDEGVRSFVAAVIAEWQERQ